MSFTSFLKTLITKRLQTLDERTFNVDNVVAASSKIVTEVLIPQFTQILDAKLGQVKADLKQELIMTVEAMKAPMKKEIKAEMV